MKIGLWAFFGFGNLGDVAIQQAVIGNIRSRMGDAEFVAICLDPKEVNKRLAIPAYPIYRGPVFAGLPEGTLPVRCTSVDQNRVDVPAAASGANFRRIVQSLKKAPGLGKLIELAWHTREELLYARKMYSLVRQLDVLVISGSGVLDDTWRGRWKRPFALYRWCLAAKVARTKLVFISVGATSLNTTLGRHFGKRALRLASYRSFRDHESSDLARQLGVAQADPVLPDLAYSLDVGQYLRQDASGSATVGIGPIPYADPRVWPASDPGIYRSYIEKFSELVQALLSGGYRIRFIVGEMRVDPLAAKDMVDVLRSVCPSSSGSITQNRISTVDELLHEIAQTDYVITSRFHGVLLPYLLSKPVLALSYNSKIRNLMASSEQQEYCMDIENFDVASCTTAFKKMVANREVIAAQLKATRQVNLKALETQYDLLLGFSP